MADSNYYVGLISGTSVDGVDCVLVKLDHNTSSAVEFVDSVFKSCPQQLREEILELCSGQNIELEKFGEIDIQIGKLFAEAVNELLTKTGIDASAIRAIGSHGQTVFHHPHGDSPFTLQIGDPNIIAQLTGISTVADFRRRDMAAGGQGAPLAPVLHRSCFSSSEENRVVINVGGISNITVLQKNGDSLAFDTGPANVLMDYWIGKHKGENFDANGDWAASGEADADLLETLLDEEYFLRPYPKSTGRELFNGPWLEAKLAKFHREFNKESGKELSAEDVQATLLEFTVASIAQDIENILSPDAIFVCGGGAHNKTLMENLQYQFENCKVESTAAVGIDPDWVEAIAFAWMAQQTIEGKLIDTSAFTGATEPVILGGIYLSAKA